MIALTFDDTKVHFIPRNLTKIFPNLVFLQINNCELKEVSAEDFVGLEELEDLGIQNNNIINLPVDLFKNMKKLREVSVSENLIQNFDEKVLEPIKDTIELFYIDKNPGINAVFKKKVSSIEDFIEQLKRSRINEQNAKKNQALIKDLEDLFTAGKYSDFVIKVGDKEYRVHKCIVAPKSSVFAKLITDNPGIAMKSFESTKNYRPEVIEEFLRYFYVRADPSPGNAIELMSLAVDFGVPDLKLQCQDAMSKTINPNSALKLFSLAGQHELHELKRVAFDVIKECHSEIRDYMYNDHELVDRILAAKEKSRSEVEKESSGAKKIKLETDE